MDKQQPDYYYVGIHPCYFCMLWRLTTYKNKHTKHTKAIISSANYLAQISHLSMTNCIGNKRNLFSLNWSHVHDISYGMTTLLSMMMFTVQSYIAESSHINH